MSARSDIGALGEKAASHCVVLDCRGTAGLSHHHSPTGSAASIERAAWAARSMDAVE
ncbi:hypothetical protein [Escherichia coli]|uniref:hypothetical protein n=1 Tax=Escherichia coli TaxID=562 RepID=UPI00214F74CB|nr:hypothetical protein [Escherichia coli]MCR4270944.1 hypothetical protein [Escherichia coli]